MLFRKSSKAAKQAAAAARAPATKPTRAAKRPAAPKSAPAATAYRKPQADLYTVLLAIALVAILIAIVFFCLEMNLYEFQFKGGPAVGMMTAQSSVLGSSCIASLAAPSF